MSEEERWYWLSWADVETESGCLGIAIVPGADPLSARLEAHWLGINPKGQCLCIKLDDEFMVGVPEEFRCRLLTPKEVIDQFEVKKLGENQSPDRRSTVDLRLT